MHLSRAVPLTWSFPSMATLPICPRSCASWRATTSPWSTMGLTTATPSLCACKSTAPRSSEPEPMRVPLTPATSVLPRPNASSSGSSTSTSRSSTPIAWRDTYAALLRTLESRRSHRVFGAWTAPRGASTSSTILDPSTLVHAAAWWFPVARWATCPARASWFAVTPTVTASTNRSGWAKTSTSCGGCTIGVGSCATTPPSKSLTPRGPRFEAGGSNARGMDRQVPCSPNDTASDWLPCVRTRGRSSPGPRSCSESRRWVHGSWPGRAATRWARSFKTRKIPRLPPMRS